MSQEVSETTEPSQPPVLDIMTEDATAGVAEGELGSFPAEGFEPVRSVLPPADYTEPTTAAPTTLPPPPPVPVSPLPLLYIVTGVFGALFIILPLLVRKGPNRGIIRCSIWLTVFSMWIFWATVYISQMRPLVGPRMHNTSIAWIKYAWAPKNK